MDYGHVFTSLLHDIIIKLSESVSNVFYTTNITHVAFAGISLCIYSFSASDLSLHITQNKKKLSSVLSRPWKGIGPGH